MRLLACAVALLLPATASATTLTNESDLRGAAHYREWIDDARGKVPLPRRVKVIEGTPCGPGGCAFPRRKPPVVAIDYTPYLWEPGFEANHPAYDRDRLIERTIFTHELGHIWDLERGAKRNRWRGYRDRYRRQSGLPLRGRWLSRHRYFEGWADAYARCVTGTDVYGYAKNQPRRVCRSLKREAR